MKLAICGSRNFTNYSKLLSVINSYFADYSEPYSEYIMPNPYRFIKEIITGDANGADSLAVRFAIEYNLPYKIYYADWTKHGKSAGPLRNQSICEVADEMIAFLGKGPGTRDSIKQMLKAGKPVLIIPIKEN